MPRIDETRRYVRPGSVRTKVLRGESLPKNGSVHRDISPDEIEQRYQRRLAELRYERLRESA